MKKSLNLSLAATLLVILNLLNQLNCISFNWKLSSLDDLNQRSKNPYKIVCYYTNWAQYRPKPGTYLPEDIDPHLCTHIIFSFAKISDNYELQAFEW
jgi:GH18 family chitinase